MMPMLCPHCRSRNHRVPITNGDLEDQIVRRRVCRDCGGAWFTVEVLVPNYAVGWSAVDGKKSQPVLRVATEFIVGMVRMGVAHVEEMDTLRNLKPFWQRDVTDCDKPAA